MNPFLVIPFVFFVAFLFSQFGARLSARNSLVWWFIFLFLTIAIVFPGGLVPVVGALGIQVVSNFVLASMILFLVFQAIQESAFSTTLSRKLRELACSAAAKEFLKKYS